MFKKPVSWSWLLAPSEICQPPFKQALQKLSISIILHFSPYASCYRELITLVRIPRLQKIGNER